MDVSGTVSAAQDIVADGGVGRLVQLSVEKVLRELLGLPDRAIVVQNAVAVRAGRLFDRQDVFLNTEAHLVNHIREFVKYGDDVVIVGGGSGVSTVWEARRVGDAGTVTVFEGGEDTADQCRETAILNGVDHLVNVRHAVVGPAIEMRGIVGDADHVPPDELPTCDVLEMDCDGAEMNILKYMTIRPERIIVETHGMLGTPPAEVRASLHDLGYEVIREDIHNEENGINLLTAVKTEADGK
jgi:hypothetical protein